MTSEEFGPFYRSQKTLLWCWATSAEMVMASQGVNLPQDAIVTFVKGFPLITTGSPADMVKATNAVLVDVYDQKVVVSGQYVIGPPQPPVLYNHLHHGRPVILTYVFYSGGSWAGHAVVLHGIDANVTSAEVQITRFYVADPFPYTQVLGPYGQPQLIEDPYRQFKVYDVQGSAAGLLLLEGGTPVGLIQGVILVDGSHP